nr:transposase [Streptomyces sp. AVP053U2]
MDDFAPRRRHRRATIATAPGPADASRSRPAERGPPWSPGRANILVPRPPGEGNDVELTGWITTARAVDLPHLRSFTNGRETDRPAVRAGLILPHHNGRTEGVSTRTKRIMRQIHGRARLGLLRHRVLRL